MEKDSDFDFVAATDDDDDDGGKEKKEYQIKQISKNV